MHFIDYTAHILPGFKIAHVHSDSKFTSSLASPAFFSTAETKGKNGCACVCVRVRTCMCVYTHTHAYEGEEKEGRNLGEKYLLRN